MIPNVDKGLIAGFIGWVEAAEDEGEREARMTGLHKMLFDGVGDAEAQRIESMLESVLRARNPVAIVPEPEVKKRAARKFSSVKFYDPERSGFMRASREEGSAAELRAVAKESRGTPLFGGDQPAQRAAVGLDSALSRDRVDRFKELLRGNSRKR